MCPPAVRAGISAEPISPDEPVTTTFIAVGRNRVSGSRHAVQLFFDVCATKSLNCGTTFVPWHFGHFTSPFSRSEKVMIDSKGLLHFSHMNS